MLLRTELSQSSIKRGPVQVEEASSNHGNDVGVVVVLVLLFLVSTSLLVLEEVSSYYAEVCTESMNSHAASNILDSENDCADCFVQSVEYHFNSCEYPQLKETAFSKDCSE